MAQKKARLIDVANAAGVSTATASFVLSGSRINRDKPASPATVRRVQEAAGRLGYVPNSFAKAVRKGHSDAIVLALGSPQDPWSAQVAIEVQARAAGQFSTLSLVDETWYTFLQGYSPSVALVTSTDLSADGLERVTHLAELGCNLVVFSTQAPSDRFDVISSSPIPSVIDAYGRLRRRHDRVHLLALQNPEVQGPTVRVRAYQDAAERHGDDVFDLIHLVGPTRAEARHATTVLLDREPEPSAVICGTGYLAEHLRDLALHRGIRVPDDLEILAIGDIPHNDLNPLGSISTYGTPDVFARVGEIVVNRARLLATAPFLTYEFTWQFQAGSSTVDAVASDAPPVIV